MSAHRARHGALVTECLVAAGLLMVGVGTFVPLVVRQQRIFAECRRERLALDELSAELDRLTLLPPDEAATALGQLAPSPRVVEALGEAKLSGELMRGAAGPRIVLSLDWQDAPGRSRRQTLVGWLAADEAWQEARR